MPPRRRLGDLPATPPIDVDDLRSRLDQGKIVRVAIAPGAQFPAGAVGRVRRIGDPEIDGEEFIHVELTINGTKDRLPFAPGDLTQPARGAAGRGAAGRVAPAAEPSRTPGRPSPRRSAGDAARPPEPGRQAAPDRTAARPAGTAPDGAAAPPADTTPAAEIPAQAPAPMPVPEAAARSRAARPKAVRRRGPAVSITVGTTDSDPPLWRIEARVGSRVVLRRGSVAPARVWELVGMLGDETLSRAVGGVLDEQRQAAQSRADALTAELAKVRAELAELPDHAVTPTM